MECLCLPWNLRYGDPRHQELCLAQLRLLVEKLDESLPEYEAHIRMPQTGSRTVLAPQHFTDGIRDQKIQKALRLTSSS